MNQEGNKDGVKDRTHEMWWGAQGKQATYGGLKAHQPKMSGDDTTWVQVSR